jgi:hypothetical protein
MGNNINTINREDIDNLYSKYHAYDASYADLQNCINTIKNANPGISQTDLAKKYATIQCPKTAYAPLQYYSILYRSAANIETDINNKINPYLSTQYSTEFQAKKQSLDSSYNQLLNVRTELDEKMNELLKGEGSITQEKINISDASVITTLLWTVMATSLLYIVFVKL